ncbi:MAG: HPr family phosphocarrier protein [Desulfovibrionales bacterium]
MNVIRSREGVLIKEVCVLNDLGLHARPAGRLAQEAQKFTADVFLISGEQKVNAKSILDILTLAASRGCSLQLEAEGPDAHEALTRLEDLFRDRFGEER